MKLLNLSGKIFGRLTVNFEAGRTKWGKSLWDCKCSCGNITTVIGSNLINGRSETCGHCAKIPDLLNKRFSKLLVLKYLGLRDKGWGHSASYWECICDCGNKIETITALLTVRNKTSCGCDILLPEKEAGIRELYRKYKNGAKKRNIEFNLKREIFDKLIISNCFYCGKDPVNVHKPKRQTSDSFVYTGIDRIDNKQGYINSNIVPCCKQCNIAKTIYSKDEFMTWIKCVYQKHFLNV